MEASPWGALWSHNAICRPFKTALRLHSSADGLLRRVVKQHGGRVLVQDPAAARAASMPSHAISTGCVDFVLPLERIASALVTLTMAPGGAELLSVPVAPWAQLPA
jgi:two-component system, chemotaxis family, protein-glutamate methylesterase/glutaminase